MSMPALALATEALEALKDKGLDPDDIDGMGINGCAGYALRPFVIGYVTVAADMPRSEVG